MGKTWLPSRIWGGRWRFVFLMATFVASTNALLMPNPVASIKSTQFLHNPMLAAQVPSKSAMFAPSKLRAGKQGRPALRMSTIAGTTAASGTLTKFGAIACALPGGLQLLISKLLGYCIFMGSFFLQVPQLLKIWRAKSVTGISLTARYSEVPINSSTVIYHFLLGLPLSTYGENIVSLVQNLILVFAVWFYRDVPKRSMILATTAFVVLCAVQLALPPALLPLLIYINIPFGIGSSLPQILDNARQGHTGQLAMLTCLMKLAGCVIRLFTTVTQIGLDPGLLLSYATGAILNIILLVQGWIYREETAKVLEEEKRQKEAEEREGGGGPRPADGPG